MSEQMPIMRQYLAIKREIPTGTILLLRSGDFYEMFGEDAVVSAPICDLALTQRDGVPMCRLSCLPIFKYISRFARCGKRIALAEVIEMTRDGVEYEVTRIVRLEVTEMESSK